MKSKRCAIHSREGTPPVHASHLRQTTHTARPNGAVESASTDV